jgi:hypothetical protein
MVLQNLSGHHEYTFEILNSMLSLGWVSQMENQNIERDVTSIV